MGFFDFGGLGWPDEWDDDDIDMAMGEPKEDPKWKSSEYAPKKEAAVVEQMEESSRPTVWEYIQAGTTDQRCRLKDVHIHDILHALGLKASTPWPPTADDFRDVFDMEEEL